MTPNNNLAPGFITVDEACEIIKSDTDANPVVDMDYLAAHDNWIEVGHNFRIPKIRRLNEKEVYRTKRGKWVEFENIGDIYVYLATAFEAELLRKTIYDKFRELTGREFKQAGTIARSTVADDATGTAAVRPRANTPIAKEGATIGKGTTQNTNGEGLKV